MSKRNRGERNWVGLSNDSLPLDIDLEQLRRAERQATGIITVCGYEFIRATDGQLELVGLIDRDDY